MVQQTLVKTQTPALARASFWKTLWRSEALINLLFGDLLIFAAGPIVNFMGIDDNNINLVRVSGVIFALYAIWQLWSTRSGGLPKSSLRIGRAVMFIATVDFAVTPLLIEFGDLGVAIMLTFAVICAITAEAWHLALRENR